MARILVFGASGLIGGLLLPRLAGHDVMTVGRRAVAGGRAAPMEDWPAVVAELQPEVVVSTLGTTIRKAGSRAAFAAVDHDVVVAVATAAKTSGARQMLTVSSVGADADSSNFYLATKGRTEADLIALGFDRLDIFRPGLLLGEREGDFRIVERIGIMLSPLTNALTPRRFDKFRAIRAEAVAASIARAVGAAAPGVHIHHNREMLEPRRDFA